MLQLCIRTWDFPFTLEYHNLWLSRNSYNWPTIPFADPAMYILLSLKRDRNCLFTAALLARGFSRRTALLFAIYKR